MTAPGARRPARLAAVAVDAPHCALGESPRWAYGAWWWVDADAGVLWGADAGLTTAGGAREVREVLRTGGRLSLAHPAGGGRLVVASGTDLLVVDPGGGPPRPWSRIDLPPGWLVNDGTADAAGRLWIGSVHPDRARGAGSLHVVATDGRVRTVATGFTLSNGMAWRSPTLMVHADSGERCLWEHEVEPGTGRLLRSRRGNRLPDAAAAGTASPGTVAAPPGGDAGSAAAGLALPDGVAVDRAGGLWVAMYGTGQVWRLVGDQVTAVVEVPTPQVTSVALGGPDGRDMLITTAREGMDAAAVAADPHAGRLFRARVRVPGSVLFHMRILAADF